MDQYKLEKLQKEFKLCEPGPEQTARAITLIAAQQKRIEHLEYLLEQEYRDPGGKSWENVR